MKMFLLVSVLLWQTTIDRINAKRCQAGTTVFVAHTDVIASTPNCFSIPGGLDPLQLHVAVMHKTAQDTNLVQLPFTAYNLDLTNQCESLVTPASVGDKVEVWKW